MERITKLYGNYKSAARRIKQLRDDNYVHVIDYLNCREHVYCVSKRYCIKENLSCCDIIKTDKLIHYLAIADYYFFVVPDKVNEIYFEKVYKFNYEGHNYSFRPDIVMSIGDKWHLVEIDLCNRRFEDKVVTWEAFYKSYSYKLHFAKFPPIIIVSTNVEKVRKIIDHEKKLGLNYIYKDYKDVMKWEYKYPP